MASVQTKRRSAEQRVMNEDEREQENKMLLFGALPP
jgi:hypothetical protein